MTRARAPRVRIGAALLARLKAGAECAYPEEFCALLLGRADAGGALNVLRIVPARNVHRFSRRAFELDPKTLVATLRSLREARAKGDGDRPLRLLGHAHSHPDARPVPSARDLALAFEPGQVWAILPVTKGRAGAPRLFQPVPDSRGAMTFRALAPAPEIRADPRTRNGRRKPLRVRSRPV